jgi:hypothetical protein
MAKTPAPASRSPELDQEVWARSPIPSSPPSGRPAATAEAGGRRAKLCIRKMRYLAQQIVAVNFGLAAV